MRRYLRLALLFTIFCLPEFPLLAQAQNQFEEVLRMGRGAVQRTQWQPNGPLILVDTVRGAWLYSNNEGRLVDVAHIEDARLACFSPDGNVLAGVNVQNEITLWNTADFAQIAMRPGHGAYIRALEWSQNGQRLASLDRTGRILVWNVASVEPAWEVSLDSADQIAWSRGGSYLAAVDAPGGIVRVWNRDGDLVFTSTPDYLSQYGFDLLWRNDKQLLIRNYGEIVSGQLWNADTGETVSIRSVGYASAYSPDGSKFVTASVNGAFVTDSDSGEILFSVPAHQASVVSWSPDGQYIALGEWTSALYVGTTVTVVDVAAEAVLRTASYDHSVTGIYWNADSTQLLILDDAEQMYVAGVEATSPGRPSNMHAEIGTAAAWRSDGQVIAAATAHSGAYLWDVQTGSVIVGLSGRQPASRLVWQPGGTLLATAGGDMWQSEDNSVYIWDTTITQDIYDHTVIVPHVNLVTGAAWSPDGETLATIERERFLRLWQSDNPGLIRVIDLWAIRLAPFVDYTQRINSLMWSPGGDRIVYSSFSSGNFGGVNIVDAAAGTILEEDTPVNTSSTWAWTPDNQFIWASWLHASYPGGSPLDSSFVLGSQPMPDEPPQLEGLRGKAVNAIFSPDASLLIGFDEFGNGIIWDVQTQTLMTELSDVNSAVWSPDNTLLATYGTDGMIRVVEAKTGAELHVFNPHFRTEPFYAAGNPQVIWSPDSQRIAVLDSGSLFIYERT